MTATFAPDALPAALPPGGIAAPGTSDSKLSTYMHTLGKSPQELSDFTHTASHDLKAPLRRIVQYCELLQEEAGDRLGPEGTGHVMRLIVQARRLQRLIDDLLSYAQVLTLQEEKRELDLNNTLREVTESLESLLKGSGAVVTAGQLPVLRVYPHRIRQVFRNLITNAVRYHGSEDPVISVACAEEGGYYLFSFRDNVIGIAEEYHKSIFKPFERLHSQEQIEGSGLGLAICAEAVALHGGSIWVESVPGGGSVFFFTVKKDGPNP